MPPPSFRPKKLDLGCFVNIRTIRDNAKRLVYEKYEAERCVSINHNKKC